MSYNALFAEVRAQLSGLGIVTMDRVVAAPCALDLPYVAACSLNAALDKKLAPTDKASLKALEAVAISTFLAMNDRCETIVLGSPALLREMRWITERDLEPFTFAQLLNEFDEEIGPGASVGSRGCNTLYEKLFVNSLTATRPSMINLYRDNLVELRYDAELCRYHICSEPFKLSLGSVLTTVAKNNRTNRTICTEPSLNMYFQKCIGNYLNRILKKHYGYDEAEQPNRNKRLARRGSIEGDIATIDLTSASDTISLRLIGEIFPSWFVEALRYTRSPATKINSRWHQLHMISSMGNGFTFPLQTYIFSVLLRAVSRLQGVRFSRYDESQAEFGVFGDDIVCPSSLFTQVCKALEDIGTIPNREKSFAHGYFRESCGGDYYNGHDVRGVYIKRLNNLSDFCSSLNRLSRFISKWGLPVSLSSSYTFAISRKAPFVPPCAADSEGLKVPESLAEGLRRRNGYRYFALVPKLPLVVLARENKMPSGETADLTSANPLGSMLHAIAFGMLRTAERRADNNKPSKFSRERKFTPFWAGSNPCWDFSGGKVLFTESHSTFALRGWLGYVERQILS
jgi:hypothetical protein